jgi:hypothetical protein
MDRGLPSDNPSPESPYAATVSWVNPSRSYPYLAISRHFSLPYDVVLTFSDYLQGRLTPTQDMALEDRLRFYLINGPSEDWKRAVHAALRAFLKIQREGM